MTNLVIAEHDNTSIKPATLNICLAILEVLVVAQPLDNTPGEELTQRTWHEDMNRNVLKAVPPKQFLNEKTGELLTKL